MQLLTTILAMIVTLGVLVSFHEYGHFWVARRCGIKVLRFSVGFGKPLVRWYDRHGTEFVIAWIPLGGYVKMVDEREGNVSEEDLPYAFNRASVWRRIAVVVAGPGANFLLAIFAYWLVFVSGVSGIAPVIGSVAPGSVAERAGLEQGQEIVSIDHQDTPTWQAINLALMQRLGETGTISFAVKYTDSDYIYESEGHLQDWLRGAEEPDLVDGIGVTPFRPELKAIIGEVVADSPASRAGLQVGDQVLAADGIPLRGWHHWVEYVRARPDQVFTVTVLRDGLTFDLDLRPAERNDDSGERYGQVGVGVQMPDEPLRWPEWMVREYHYGPVDALTASLERTWTVCIFTLESIKKLFDGRISPKNLSGPITIAKVAGASAQSGFQAFMGLLALLSISLGVLNLLPIPVLDGGHLMYYLIEAVKGSPVSDKIQAMGYQVGLFIVVGITVFALYNDIARL